MPPDSATWYCSICTIAPCYQICADGIAVRQSWFEYCEKKNHRGCVFMPLFTTWHVTHVTFLPTQCPLSERHQIWKTSMKDRPSDLPNRRGVAKIKVSDLCSNYWEPIPLLHILPYFIENICIDKHIFSLTSLLPVTTNTISNKSSWGNFQLWAQNIKQGKSKAKLQRVKKILGQEWHWSSWWSLWSSRIPVSLLIGSLLWFSYATSL